jgi:hypothetical protein
MHFLPDSQSTYDSAVVRERFKRKKDNRFHFLPAVPAFLAQSKGTSVRTDYRPDDPPGKPSQCRNDMESATYRRWPPE